MGFVRTSFYGVLITGTFVALHFSPPEFYAPVRKHPLYEDFVTPAMKKLVSLSTDAYRAFMKNEQVASLVGHPAVPHAKNTEDAFGKKPPVTETDEGPSAYAKNFALPSQMGFSLVQLGEKLKKRSVLSTEGNDSTYFEMPDGSRLWMQRNSVVEVGWTDKGKEDSELLLRVEKGMMHLERPGAATGRVYLVTNSGVRYALAPADAWMATAQMGVADKETFPDADLRMSGRYMDYVRRASLAEARELSKMLKADDRRETMLYQDQLRLTSEDEDRHRQNLDRAGIMPVEVVSIPLEIPTRRGGRDLARQSSRMPASLAVARPLKFPGRAPASVASSLDEGTRVASEVKINKWTDQGHCDEAKAFFEKLRKEHGLGDADAWTLRMKQNFAQRCP